ncbi:MAG TPA: DUF3311 domain-containing protein [Ktedonobacteraceae bacterium]|nr:DUF3311 domain-containing protein [Ktedonobacteraceae bacterium]
MSAQPQTPARSRRRPWLRILLIVPFIILLYPPFYNSINPTFIGMPFFYWFPLAMILATAILTGALYLLGA